MTIAPRARDPEVAAPAGASGSHPDRQADPAAAISAPLAHRASRFDLVGDLDAAIVLAEVARDGASAMLPEGLRLAAPSPGDRHPLLFVLGRQRNVRFAFSPFGIDYCEFILAVPSVEHARSGAEPAGRFTYLPCLLLDRWLPTNVGRLLLAYEKRHAAIAATDLDYRITSRSTGEPLLSARFRPASWSIDELPPAPLREIMQLPLISRRARGVWRYSVAQFALDRARTAPLELELVIERPFVPGLPTGPLAFDGASGSAFRLRTSWRLTGPCARRSPPAIRGWTTARRSGDMTAA
jgi:hypothetical protein